MAFLFNNASVPDVNEDSFCLLGKSFGVLAKRKAVKYLVEDGDGTCTPSQLMGVQSPGRGKRVLDSEVLPFLQVGNAERVSSLFESPGSCQCGLRPP